MAKPGPKPGKEKKQACPTCGKRFPVGRSAKYNKRKYCSRSCSSQAPKGRSVEAICHSCGKEYTHYKSKKRKYCSPQCGHAATRPSGYRIKESKDLNHDELVDALRRMGAGVYEAHTIGGGFPDLIVGVRGVNHLAEIKNPETSYGRSGPTESQAMFAGSWRGCSVYLLYTVDDCQALIEGRYDELSTI